MARRSCLVIGASGFVGSALAAEAADLGWVVTAVGRTNYHEAVGRRFDVLLNANGNASRQRARREPLFDLEASVVSVQRTLDDFTCDHYALISTVDVYTDPSRPESTPEDAAIDLAALDSYGFHKRLAELLIARQCDSWQIFRLAQMVGAGLKKGPIYDLLNHLPLWIDERSELHYMHTRHVAHTILRLIDEGPRQQAFNVCGRGSISLREVIALLPERLRQVSFAAREQQHYRINTDKTHRLCPLPESIDEVRQFLTAETRELPLGR